MLMTNLHVLQDTFWRTSLLDLNIEDELVDQVDDNNEDGQPQAADIVFDRAADTAGSLIAGGYYLARPTEGARRFFARLSSDLAWWCVLVEGRIDRASSSICRYAPDNAYMTSLCADSSLVHCGHVPFT